MDQRDRVCDEGAEPPELWRAVPGKYRTAGRPGTSGVNGLVEHGLGGLGEQSQRPHGHAHQLCEDVVCRVGTAEAGASTLGGPRKIRSCTSGCTAGRRFRARAASSESGWRPGSTEPRRTRVARGAGAGWPRAPGRRTRSGAWFQGVVAGPERARVEPLSVRDEAQPDDFGAKSGSGRADGRRCQARLRSCSDPARSCPGRPGDSRAASRAVGLSRLSVWWLALGIQLEQADQGVHWTTGHTSGCTWTRRELVAGRIGDKEAAFEQWRQEFNTERPTKRWDETPAEVYRPSPRAGRTPEALDY